ncbi:MAG: tetratricopeptide repeat protein, partial [Planctomycetota bacterium]|nr:tetratricopeptide repeat protein [Planctomycetota bacterium]
MKRQLILGLSIVFLASLGGCGPTAEEKAEYEKAIKDYSKAIGLGPAAAHAWKDRFLAASKGQYDQLIKDRSEAIKLRPDYAGAWFSRGLAYQNAG